MAKRYKEPTIGLTLRVTLDLKQRIEAAAEEAEETQNAWAISALEAALGE